MPESSDLSLAFELTFADLYDRTGLITLDRTFLAWLTRNHADLAERLLIARAAPDGLEAKDYSQLLVDIAPHLETFLAELFDIEPEVAALKVGHDALSALYDVKRLFVQRRAVKIHGEMEALTFDGAALRLQLAEYLGDDWDDLAYATAVGQWMQAEAEAAPQLDLAARYAAWAVWHETGRQQHRDGVLFKVPHKLDFTRLLHLAETREDGVLKLRTPEPPRLRAGFDLTDPGASLEKALDEAHYCIYCHNQGKDSCSKGLKEKDGSFRKNPLGVTLNGCPLEEKISEMNLLKSQGLSLAALAVAVIDNPMVAGTGHRICNDCMKSCIYQKQEPVNIPQIETRTLSDVLSLPWGFEIYSLLTRWNPLNLSRPVPLAETGRKVLIAGLGPAGVTLSHHLLQEGHTVVGIDGLKIEPLPEDVSGMRQNGARVPFKPIRNVQEELFEPLGERVAAGFGGVAEYGITVRWNKNYLTLLRLLLERRAHFAQFGGVRFGGTVTVDTAWELGFDHVALCMGAGRPTVLNIPNGVARGVRAASDFLMALQLTGAARMDSIANLQLRLPVVVVGGGLTAIDTATESLAYYPVQVEKFLRRYETLALQQGEAAVRSGWSEEETEIAETFIAHARALRAEREAAAAQGRAPNPLALLESWGGVTIAYRRDLADSPSYRLNHEEVALALEEGIAFAPHLAPLRVEVDRFGHAEALVVSNPDGESTLPARTVLVAAGTSPNTVLAREVAGIPLDGSYFQAVDLEGKPVAPERVAKPTEPQVLLKRFDDGRGVSFFGDLHPSYAGNVVKAMGSAKQGYPVVCSLLASKAPASAETSAAFLGRMHGLFHATVHKVNRLTPTIVEVVIRAPLAARQFEPGQFYRLQNYETYAQKLIYSGTETTLAMEGLAMTGAWVDKEKGLVSVIALEMGGSSDLCATLAPDEPVVLMGPTGAPTEIPEGETVVLAGGGLGNAVLFSIGRAMREKGCRVLYFAGYKRVQDRYKVPEIEAAADAVVWCCDEAPGFIPSRPQDMTFVGNIVEAIRAYGTGELGSQPVALNEADRIIAIGSDRMMAAIGAARHGILKPYLKPGHVAIGSINSPMQCMMKEICAQCLQQHVDPVTGAVTYVFTCFNQDQSLDVVSFPHLNERLRQNGLPEKLTARWIDACLRTRGLREAA